MSDVTAAPSPRDRPGGGDNSQTQVDLAKPNLNSISRSSTWIPHSLQGTGYSDGKLGSLPPTSLRSGPGNRHTRHRSNPGPGHLIPDALSAKTNPDLGDVFALDFEIVAPIHARLPIHLHTYTFGETHI